MKIECTYGFNGAARDGTDPFPAYQSEGAAAVDLCATECVWIKPGQVKGIRTQFAVALPEGVAALVLPRSGLGSKGLVLANTVGLIDSDYRGEITVLLLNRNTSGPDLHVEEGMRCAQLMFIPYVKAELVKVNKLSETARGEGGFGSTGA